MEKCGFCGEERELLDCFSSFNIKVGECDYSESGHVLKISYVENDAWYGTAEDELEINYCPKCGRRLMKDIPRGEDKLSYILKQLQLSNHPKCKVLALISDKRDGGRFYNDTISFEIIGFDLRYEKTPFKIRQIDCDEPIIGYCDLNVIELI